jgi:hypothetical protein
MYAPEQAAIRKRVIDILELDDLNSTTLYELDNNTEKQAKFMALIPEIRKFFSFSKMAGISEPQQINRPWLSLIKHMLRTDYAILRCDYRFTHPEQGLIRTKRYVFQRLPTST